MKLLNWFTTLLLIPTLAIADDAELYDPAPPANSAFVRVAVAEKSDASLGGVNLGKLTAAGISDYHIIPAGKQKFSAGKAAADFTIAAGKYYTVLLSSAAKATLIEDTQITNPAKTRVYFYNLSDAAAASVFAPKQKVAVVDKVAANAANSREMNALALPLEVKAGETSVKTFDNVTLKRRIGTSFLLTGKKGDYQAVMVQNAVKR